MTDRTLIGGRTLSRLVPMNDEQHTPRSLSLDTVYGPSKQSERPIRFALIGAGSTGAEHVETVQAVGRGRVVGICDPSKSSLWYTFSQCTDADLDRRYATREQACGDPDVDAVIIATPNNTHRVTAEAAARAQKNLLIRNR